MKRATIADVARRAGVTKAAVSFALNDQPGVSAATRERILAIANELGFQPSSAARALSDGRAGAFGLIIDRPPMTFGEPYHMQLIAGIQAELSRQHTALLLTMVEDQSAEIELYKTWWAQGRVDGVFLIDLQFRDRRTDVLREIGMPAIAFSNPRAAGSFPAVWQDELAVTRDVVDHLVGLGHQRIARIGGIPRYWHTKLRTDAFDKVARSAGIEAVSVECDYTSEHGGEATRTLLLSDSAPTAIVYDNDLMAVAGQSAAQQMGVEVPARLSVVSWDDSVLCQLVHPSITAFRREIAETGAEAARRLIRAVDGEEVADFEEPRPVLTIRGSTGPASLPSDSAVRRIGA